RTCPRTGRVGGSARRGRPRWTSGWTSTPPASGTWARTAWSSPTPAPPARWPRCPPRVPGCRWPPARAGGRAAATPPPPPTAAPQRGRTLHFRQQITATGVRWPLAAITNRNGHRIDLDYDPTGALTAVRHSGGYRITVDTADDRITALHLHHPERGGSPVPLRRYGYHSGGHLAEAVNPSGRPMRFDYDADGRMTRWTDRNGCWYRYTYDAAGRCVRGENPGGYLDATFDYDPAGRVTRATDSLGHTTTYHVNERGQV